MDFDFDACLLEVSRSIVKVSREHHPQGKTFLVREYTKNGGWRRIKLDGSVVELLCAFVAEHGIGPSGVIFPASLAARVGETRRWAKSRDADEPYLDETTWDRIWGRAVKASGVPSKPTAYQVRHARLLAD